MYMAQRLGVPTVIHEQNRLLGVANRVLASRATRILLSYAETRGDFPADKARVVGNPVRTAFANPPDPAEARKRLGLDSGVPTVLVTGGSQGARTLNDAAAGAIGRFERDEAQFIWLTGHSEAARCRAAVGNARANVHIAAFLDDMATAFAASDLIVSRAGASSTAEIALMRKPSVLVPFPYATDNHQEHNARTFGDAGAAEVLLDHKCSADRLTELLRELLGNPERLANMARAAASLARPAAADAIADEILSIVFAHQPPDETHGPN
jgi:UDP-N-acetylglucosamine--N-acetylmuramyl-(pentapeptide) pyrophosphoryl-undecaprenol N-acetylglucosamine transferase